MTRMRIFMTGVGGQGTLLASRVLGEAALTAGFHPLLSETHGMAQRGGVVTSTVILGDLKSPIISPARPTSWWPSRPWRPCGPWNSATPAP